MLGYVSYTECTNGVHSLKYLEITEAVSQIELQGVKLEAAIQADNNLKLSTVTITSSQNHQLKERFLNLDNEIKHRRIELAHATEERAAIRAELDELGNDDEGEIERLEQLAKEKTAIIRQHSSELKRLESQEHLNIKYEVTQTGEFDVIPAGSAVCVGFLKYPVTWLPRRTATPYTKVQPRPMFACFINSISLL